jgi:tetratricopeptide (TPR) repeat protein
LRSVAFFCVAASSVLFLSGCGKLGEYAKVIEGNRLHERGDYQGAIVAYLGNGASASGAAGAASRDFPATVDYDLANVYARLGEERAAAELYEGARKAARGAEGGAIGAAIVADSRFNEGVVLYERGRFEEAWKSFRLALRGLDPSSSAARDARRNLELSWRAWKKSVSSPPGGIAPSSRGSPGADSGELRLLERLETGRWRPGGEAPPSSGEDY